MLKKKSVFASAVVLAIALSGQASTAATVDLTRQDPNTSFGNPNWSERVSRTITINPNGKGATPNLSVRAGMFRLVENMTRNILAFCIEPGISLNLSQTFETAVAPNISAARLVNVDKLYTSSYASALMSEDAAVGFQLALWEIAAETDLVSGTSEFDFDLGKGNHFIVASDAALDAGNLFLSNLATASTGGYKLTTYANGGQDLVSGTPSPVPLPAGGLLVLTGLGAFAAIRRKKTKS